MRTSYGVAEYHNQFYKDKYLTRRDVRYLSERVLDPYDGALRVLLWEGYEDMYGVDWIYSINIKDLTVSNHQGIRIYKVKKANSTRAVQMILRKAHEKPVLDTYDEIDRGFGVGKIGLIPSDRIFKIRYGMVAWNRKERDKRRRFINQTFDLNSTYESIRISGILYRCYERYGYGDGMTYKEYCDYIRRYHPLDMNELYVRDSYESIWIAQGFRDKCIAEYNYYKWKNYR